MNFFLEVIKNYTDLVLFLIIWLVILLIYILRQKRHLEQEILRRREAEDEELSRQSKGRLTSLDVIVSSQGEDEASESHSSGPNLSSPPVKPSPPLNSPPVKQKEQSKSSEAPKPEVEEAALLTQYTSGDGGGVEEMERMLEQDPNNLQLLDWLAFMYYSNNDIKKAIQTYTRIIEIEPNNASQHYYLGNCFFKNNQKEKALAEWNTVIALKPNSKYARKAQERIAKLGTHA